MYGAYYNQQGGTGRKRKRSKSQKKSKQQQTNQSRSYSEFQFDVEIPDYYHRDMPLRLHSTTISNGQSKDGGGHQVIDCVDRQKMSLGDFMDYSVHHVSSTTAKQKQDDTPSQAKKDDDAAGGKSPEEIKVDTQVNKEKDVATIDKQDKQTPSSEGVKDDTPQAKKDNDVVASVKSPEKTNLAHQKQSKCSPVKDDIQVRNDQGAEVETEDPKSKRHKDFINALERYGSSDRAWDKISYQLKWTVKDVKVYAYSYFKSLIKERTANIYERMDLSMIANDAQGMKRKNDSTSNKTTTDEDTTEDSEWSFHEIILLDSLMVKYCKNISCLEVNNEQNSNLMTEERNNDTWEKIASQLPGRAAHTCKKEGIKRLLSLYGEGKEVSSSNVN